MALFRWDEINRATLTTVLPDALVVLPVGATEQHGPHLPTGTDALLVTAVTGAAAQRAAPRAPRDVVLAPTLPFGASDHHFPFGGTLSLSQETMTAAMVELAGSVGRDGGHRMVIVNGHGGNKGACFSAAAAASTRHGMA
ncbi:MAG: creatininase family protein, partial [Solirubrobacterales bacterium]|nr:creatininase family protein [Solirubrobacterales bacterium]